MESTTSPASQTGSKHGDRASSAERRGKREEAAASLVLTPQLTLGPAEIGEGDIAWESELMARPGLQPRPLTSSSRLYSHSTLASGAAG